MHTEILAEKLGLTLDEFREILDLYVQTTSSDLTELSAAITAGDAMKAHEKAHSIKGSSANLGFRDLHLMAKEIDDRAQAGSLDGLAGLADRFGVLYRRIVSDLMKNC